MSSIAFQYSSGWERLRFQCAICNKDLFHRHPVVLACGKHFACQSCCVPLNSGCRWCSIELLEDIANSEVECLMGVNIDSAVVRQCGWRGPRIRWQYHLENECEWGHMYCRQMDYHIVDEEYRTSGSFMNLFYEVLTFLAACLFGG